MVGGALERHQCEGLSQTLRQLHHQAGFSNPRFTGDQEQLTLTVFRLGVFVAQQSEFQLSADQRRKMSGLQRFKAGGRCAEPEDSPGMDGRFQAAHTMLAEISKLKRPAEQPPGRSGNQDLVRTGERLQARRQIWCFSHQGKLSSRPITDEIAGDDNAAGDSDADLKPLRSGQGGQRLENSQRSVYRAFRIAFARRRETEIGEDAIAQEPRDVAVKKPDRIRATALELKQDLAQVFWIELRRQRGRAHQITNQDGEMTPFGLDCSGGGQALDFVTPPGRRRGQAAIFRDCLQQSFSMAKRDAEPFKILLIEAGEDFAINVIFGEKVGILAQANALKPMPDVRHFAGKRVLPLSGSG